MDYTLTEKFGMKMAEIPVPVLQSDLPIAAKLEKARAELLDLSARNRLLNVPRFSKIARTVEVVDERSSAIFQILVRDGRVLTFTPGREGAGDETGAVLDDEILAELPQPSGNETVDENGMAARHADTKLQTRMTSKGLQKRLLDLYGDSRTLEEEQGVNVLYLALGMLKWIDPQNAANIRNAPLILVPVILERGSAGERFRLRARLEDLSANLSLEAYLDRVHSLALPPLEPNEDFEPAGYFEAVANAIETKEGWEVKPDDIVLGFFSFAKFLMYRDLDPSNWPANETIADRPLIKSLLADGFDAQEGMLGEDTYIDQHIAPADMLHIVDCDSSQTLAVHDVRQGRDLVIQGPPGTGKSQTISNIIASAVADGKTVLFVAEKMAALEVVKRRLDKAAIGDVCLELHSNKANKRLMLEELRRTWDLGGPKGEVPSALMRRLTEARDVLNEHAERLHRPHPMARLTPFDVFGQLARLRHDGRRPVEFDLPRAPSWNPEGVAQREALLAELAERVLDIGLPDQHPWRGVGLEIVLPTTVERLMARLRELLTQLKAWAEEQAKLSAILETEAPHSLATTTQLITLGRRVSSAPLLDAEALSGPHWSDNAEAVFTLLARGKEFEDLSISLKGQAAPAVLGASVSATISALAALPPAFGARGFDLIRDMAGAVPRLLGHADKLNAELGRSASERTLADLERLISTAERVAAAPDASPEAFAATVWDHGVEQAGDLAQAVAAFESARTALGGSILDAAWTTDITAARQALASHRGFLRRLSADWRRANALMRSILRDPEVPVPELLEQLDILAEGQAALKSIKEGHEFGKAAFGPDWRGEKSSSAPLIALVDWMRTLRGLGAEPRLIAGRVPQRSALGQMAAAMEVLHRDVHSKLEALRGELNGVPVFFDDSLPSGRVVLPELATALGALALADDTATAAAPGMIRVSERLDVLHRIAARQEATRIIEASNQIGTEAFGGAWRGELSDWHSLDQAAQWITSNQDIRKLASRIPDRPWLLKLVQWVDAVREDLMAGLNGIQTSLKTDAIRVFGKETIDTVSLSELTHRLSDWLNHGEQLSKWVAYRERANRANEAGLTPLVERLAGGHLAPADIVPTFEMAYFEALLADMVSADPELARFDGTLHAGRAREFADLDRQRISVASLEVVLAHHRGIPAQVGIGPVGVLRGEMARRRGHMPIRQLVQRAGPAIQALKPVLMMS
ncbi:MAG TPA: DUF4011 domain-containing protein, partial [Rhodopila sp.]|uniref:DUF4011 domain-containing protein n=1 Tax=Rhodopila sp. TaxID=2480087 RepID=UPI002C7DC0EF